MRIARASLFLPVLVVTVMFVGGPALASEIFCVNFEGIDGGPPVIQGCPAHTSMGLEYHHLVARDLDNGIPGSPRHHQVIFTKSMDKATVPLWEKLDNGEAILTVEFTFLQGSPYQQGPYIVTLSNARVLGIEPIVPHVDDSGNGGFGNQERIRLNYESMMIEDVLNNITFTITP